MASEKLEGKKPEEEASVGSKRKLNVKEPKEQKQKEEEQESQELTLKNAFGESDEPDKASEAEDETKEEDKVQEAEEEDEDGQEKASRKVKRSARKRISKKEKSESKKSNQESNEKEPVTPSNDRPTRERKVVERYSVPSVARSSSSKALSIEKVFG